MINSIKCLGYSTIPILSEPGVHYSNWSCGAVHGQISILIFAHAEHCRHGLVLAAPAARVSFLPCATNQPLLRLTCWWFAKLSLTVTAYPVVSADALSCGFFQAANVGPSPIIKSRFCINTDALLLPSFSFKANKAFSPCWCRWLQGKFATSNLLWCPSLSGNHGKFSLPLEGTRI